MMQATDLFAGFDPALVAAVRRGRAQEVRATGTAKATKRHNKHVMRRAKSEATLAEILPARFERGETWHVMSHGDVDALSYLRHGLAGVSHFDFVLVSTWCIAAEDMAELQGWVDTGRIDNLTLCVGEIFPSQYGDEYELACKMVETYGVRLIIARNHSKVILARNDAEGYALVMEGSANVNTNPRIEQTAVTNDSDLLAFYEEFYHGLRSIDTKRTRPAG